MMRVESLYESSLRVSSSAIASSNACGRMRGRINKEHREMQTYWNNHNGYRQAFGENNVTGSGSDASI